MVAQERLDDDTPINPYRALKDLHATLDETVGIDNVVATHDAGSPRDQMSPFWNSTTPLSYIGWGKTTQLGTGLGYAMGAKVSCPEKTCLNVWGDAAIGMTGMDFETAVRENHSDPERAAEQLLDGDRAADHAARPPRSTEPPTSPVTTPTWPRPSAATASASSRPAT